MNPCVPFCVTSAIFSQAFSFCGFSGCFHRHYLICHPSIVILLKWVVQVSVKSINKNELKIQAGYLNRPRSQSSRASEAQVYRTAVLSMRPQNSRKVFKLFLRSIHRYFLRTHGLTDTTPGHSFRFPLIMDI